MTEYRYKLHMAGALWDISVPMELDVNEYCAPFLTDAPGADCTLHFRLAEPEETGVLVHAESPRVWQTGETLRIERESAGGSRCASIDLDLRDPLHVEGRIYPKRANAIRGLEQLLQVSELELLLTGLDAFQLHSSLVRIPDGTAILFTAPSGTGKSTQAALWERYAGGDTLNGDRSILRRLDGVWTAFGSPFAGTSGIYRDESAPIRALVVLRQAPENTLSRLSAPEAFRAIYSESVLPRWNTEAHQRILDLITAVIGAVPVYRLSCTPDERAVTLLRETLEGESV